MTLLRRLRAPHAAILGACLLAALARRAPAQTEVPIDPELVISDARAAYRAAPTADEVTVVLRPDGPAAATSGARRERFIAKIDPGPADTTHPRRAVIHLGPLTALLEHNAVTVTHEADPASALVHASPGPPSPEALAAALPPVPWPQLALASDADPGFAAPTPYTREVRWREATLDPSTQPPTATVTGRSDTGPISMTINAETGRLMRLIAQVSSGPPTVLDITARPVDPGDPAAWAPPADGRQHVASLTELIARSDAPVRIGDPSPEIILLGTDLDQWTLTGAIAATERPRPAAVLLFRLPGDETEAAAVLRDAMVGRDALRAAASGPDELASAAGAVMDLSAFSRGGFETLRREWAALREPAKLGVDELRWTSTAPQTIDRFAPGAQAALVVVGADRQVRAVIRLDGLSEDKAAAAAVADTVREAITPRPSEPEPAPEADR